MKLEDIKNMSLAELVENRVITLYAEASVFFPDELSYDRNGHPNFMLAASRVQITNLFETQNNTMGLINNIYQLSQINFNSYTPEKKKKRTGYLYIMENTRNGFYKIGFTTKTPEYREQTLQAEEPEIKLVFSSEKTKTTKDEREIHAIFEYCRMRGEWFCLNDSELNRVKKLMETK